MDNWLGVFLLIISGAVVNLAVAFGVLRTAAGWAGIPSEINTPRRTLISLLTIVPVAGVAGAPFFLIPFMGPLLGVFVSACVAPMLLAKEYQVTQALAAKLILPTVAVIYVLSGAILYFGIPMI